MSVMNQHGPLVARILLAQIFVIAGYGKIGGFDGTVGYIQSVGLPAAHLVAVLAIVIEIGGGIMLIVGWKARWAAALFVFTLLAAVIFHPFWAAPADQATMQQIQFVKNLGIMGGMLSVLVYGAGPVAVDRRM